MRYITLVNARTGIVEYSAPAETIRHAVLASGIGIFVQAIFGGEPIVVDIGPDELPDDKIAVFDVLRSSIPGIPGCISWPETPVGRVALGRVFSLPRKIVLC